MSIISAAVIIFGCTLPAFCAEAEATDSSAAVTLAEGSISDHLESETDKNLYEFEMETSGDAVIGALGLMEESVYGYHWKLTVYASDGVTPLASSDVRGYAQPMESFIGVKSYAYEVFISLPELDAGKYFIEMSPLTYTDASYSLTLYKHTDGSTVSYPTAGVQTVSKANETLCVLNDIAFVKMYDGDAYLALQTSRAELVLPVLVSTDPSAVEYMIVSMGRKIRATSSPVEYNGVTYFYSEINDVYFEDPPELYTPDRPADIYYSTASVGDIVEDVLIAIEQEELGDEYEDELGEEMSDFIGKVKYYWQHYWWILLVIVGIVLYCIIGSAIGVSRSDDDPLIHMTGDEYTGDYDGTEG